jgi:hypothetical protein
MGDELPQVVAAGRYPCPSTRPGARGDLAATRGIPASMPGARRTVRAGRAGFKRAAGREPAADPRSVTLPPKATTNPADGRKLAAAREE